MEISKKQAIEICKKIKEEFVAIKFLSRGNHNESYLLITKTKHLVLRIENNNQFKNLKKEYEFLKLINGKFAPKVYFFDNSHKIIPKDYLLEEFINGNHPERKVDNNFIILMAKWYKKLHSHKKIISKTERKQKTLYYNLIKYHENIKQYKLEVPKMIWNLHNNLINDIIKYTKKHAIC